MSQFCDLEDDYDIKPNLAEGYIDEVEWKEAEKKIDELTAWLGTSVPVADGVRQIQKMDCIGSGAFGNVFKTTYQDRTIAVKKISLHDQNKVEYARLLESFKREVTNIRECNHPNIVQYIGCFIDQGTLNLMTEYMSNGSLEKMLHDRSKNVEIELRYSIAADICSGMCYLHEMNPQIIHRDLSSSNVLLDSNWVAKISDFGLSRVKEQRENAILATRVGRLRYAAPEITTPVGNQVVYTERVDVYSFGIVLWEIFTREIPFSNAASEYAAMVMAQRNERPTPMPRCVDQTFNDMITRCWGQDPSSRPSFREMVPYFQSLVSHR